MIEKTMIAALLGIFGTVGYAEIAEQAEPILHEANLVAVSMQERELTTALELYWLKSSAYPDVLDNELARELHDAGVLKSDDIVYDISYSTTRGQQRYELQVS
jgi:hypothetical protein